MSFDLVDTSASQINSELLRARRREGSPAMGMVLTLIIVTDEREHYDALKAAVEASREHPARILCMVPRPGRSRPRLDAEIRVGSDSGSGETVLMRMHGPLSQHAASIVLPLLLPESPVVAWWPGDSPAVPAEDEIGALAMRRVTDLTASRHPVGDLEKRARAYHPGDTDLAWTRLTPWRSMLAAALDQRYTGIQQAVVGAERSNPSAELFALWLEERLGVLVDRKTTRGPGITEVRLRTVTGDIAISRPDGILARLDSPGQPRRPVALKRRELSELIAEELRRLDPDDVYATVLRRVISGRRAAAKSPAKLSPRQAAAKKIAAEEEAPQQAGSAGKSGGGAGGRKPAPRPSRRTTTKATSAAIGEATAAGAVATAAPTGAATKRPRKRAADRGGAGSG